MTSNPKKRGMPAEPSLDELRLAAAGDRAAFTRLVEQHQTMVYSIAYNLLGNRQDAEDAAQEAFLRCFTKLGQFRGESSFATWLFRVSVTAAADLRRRRPRGEVELSDAALDVHAFVVADPADALVAGELLAALAKLPAAQRLPVVLRDVYGMSYAEVAAMLHRPQGTVRVMVYRGRVALRKALRSGSAAPVFAVADQS